MAHLPVIPLRTRPVLGGKDHFWLILGAPIVTLVLTTVGIGILMALMPFLGDSPGGLPFEGFTSLVLLMFLLMSVGQCFMYLATVLIAYLLVSFSGRLPLSHLLLLSPVIALLTWFGFKFILPLVPIPFPTPDDLLAQHPVVTFLIEFAMSWVWTTVILLGYWWPFRNFGKPEQVPGMMASAR